MFVAMTVVGCIGLDKATVFDEPEEEFDDVERLTGEFADARAWLYAQGVIHDFFVELSDDARANLDASPSEDVRATVVYDGDAFDVGLHLRGNWSFRTLAGKPSLKLDFHAYDSEQTLRGVRRLTLTNMVQDGSMLRDEAAYWLFRASGVPAPRHSYARLWINGEWYGLYGVVETIDEQFLADHFVSNDGNAYGGGYGADLDPGCASLFTLEESGDSRVAPYADLRALIDEVRDADDVVALIDARFGGRLLRYFAVEAVAGQRDGYVSSANNYVLYSDPEEARWTMLPWGPDQSFRTEHDDMYDGWAAALAWRCAEDAACRAEFAPHVDEVLAVWDDGLLAHLTAVQTMIADDCEHDPRAEDPCGGAQRTLLEYINERPDGIRASW